MDSLEVLSFLIVKSFKEKKEAILYFKKKIFMQQALINF